MARGSVDHRLSGTKLLVSPWFSNRWEVRADNEVIALIRRHGRIHVSTVELPDGSMWALEPAGTGAVVALDSPDHEIARITRRSWWGRRWEVGGASYAMDLVSDPRPRRWRYQVGGSTIGTVSGSLVSYNRVLVDCQLALPLSALLLGWHVIARPWEAAAAPRGLIPIPHGPTDEATGRHA